MVSGPYSARSILHRIPNELVARSLFFVFSFLTFAFSIVIDHLSHRSHLLSVLLFLPPFLQLTYPVSYSSSAYTTQRAHTNTLAQHTQATSNSTTMRFTTIVLVLSTIVATAHVSAIRTGFPSDSRGGEGGGGGQQNGGSGGNDSGFGKRHLVVPDSSLHNLLRRPAGIVDQRLKAIWNSYRQEEEQGPNTSATTRSLQRKAVNDAMAEFRTQLIQQVQDFVDAQAVTSRDVSQVIQGKENKKRKMI